jgi:2-keto-4-pentenoate hydratase/2-oxohepta-3-ene-1,7-dioic acid hydratase in catechol pathway
MQYQLFSYLSSGTPRSGIVVGQRWFDLGGVALQTEHHELANRSVDDLLRDWDDSHARLRRLARLIDADPAAFARHGLDIEKIELLTPQLQPGAIYGAGANYRDHVEAMSRAFNMNLVLDPKSEGIAPWHFLKAGRANLSAHREKVPFPKDTHKLDWEAELAVVIGRRGFDVPVEDALDHVAGYMCANDLSARDYLVRQAVDASSPFRFDWIGHKCFAGSCPLGPVLTPAEFVGSPESLDIKLWLNGEIKQDSNTSNHLYNVAEQISYLSRRMELFPGDVILTGTPAGVGMESGTFLKPGDVMKVWIAGLGELETTLV